jgi:hypothetical protein
MTPLTRGCAVVMFLALIGDAALAQTSKSGPLAKQLVAALEAAKLDSIAAKDPAGPDVYVGALYITGFQLLVVSGSYAAPALLDARISKKEYRDTYMDLTGASSPATRIMIEDLGADGLKAKREDNAPFDVVSTAGKSTQFDTEWRKQKLSEEEYMKAFSAADDRYASILQALIVQTGK